MTNTELNSDFPDFLYRYRPCGTDYFSEEIRQIKSRGIFLTSPAQLNDPFDSLPSIVKSPLLDFITAINQVGFRKFKRYRLDRARESGLYDFENFKKLKQKYASAASAARLEATISRSAHIAYREHDLKIACFSEDPCSTLMWAHYAEGHKGFAVKYALDLRPSDFGHDDLPLPVQYTSERPKLSTLELSSIGRVELTKEGEIKEGIRDSVFDALYYTKSLDWKYEREWRLNLVGSGAPSYHYFGSLVPTEIIFGAKMSEENRAFVRQILIPIRCKEIVVDAERYLLKVKGAN